jgi:hypothetical protein
LISEQNTNPLNKRQIPKLGPKASNLDGKFSSIAKMDHFFFFDLPEHKLKGPDSFAMVWIRNVWMNSLMPRSPTIKQQMKIYVKKKLPEQDFLGHE